jgi:ADP-heptose:LPS heptosyltransferase
MVMLTAAVRDLHRSYPEKFITDVRTHHPALWDNNPYLTPLVEGQEGVELLDCHYPLVQESNQLPYHFIHGFISYLNDQLGLNVKPTEFRGDIHLSREEELEPVPFKEQIGTDLPRWLICSGGKRDFTIKWWDVKRYQQVVDNFRGRIQFVQVGASGDYHPELNGVVDLRAKTDLRTLIKLIYHLDGVVCPVSLLMHLAAAVPIKSPDQLRPCVVIAGGREPAHWEAYPGHQFLHTIGMLACCQTGGCWRSRALPLPDRSTLNRSERLCVDIVGNLPRCMDMIQATEVIAHVEHYVGRHDHKKKLLATEAAKLSVDNADNSQLDVNDYDVISRAAVLSLRNGHSDEDRILSFYRSVNSTPKLRPIPDMREKVLTNTPQGLGDTLLLTALPKIAVEQGTFRYIGSDSLYFETLMRFNPFYVKPEAGEKIAADILQRRYDMGNGHLIQRLQRAAGLIPEMRPKGFVHVANEIRDNRIALHFEAGDSHAAWQRIYVHPRARQLYPESRLLIQFFINAHPEITFFQVGRRPIPLDNVQNCTGLPLADSIKLLNTCEYFIGIISGPMHLATALGLKCVVILNFPKAEEIYLPTLKDINLIESEWLYPQNVHLHQEGDGPLVKRLTLSNLERAVSGQIYPYWSDKYLELINERL